MVDMRTQRDWRKLTSRVALALLVIIAALIFLEWYVSRPFQTQHVFTEHLRNERFDKAIATIDPADRDRIPDAYWEQFRGNPPVSLIVPTLGTFVNGRMSMTHSLRDKRGGMRGSGIRYEVYGNRICVREVLDHLRR